MNTKDQISPKTSLVNDSVSSKTAYKDDSNRNTLENGIDTLEFSGNKVDSAININGKMGLDDFVLDGLDYRDRSDDSEDDSSSDSGSGFPASSSSSSISSEDDDVLVELPVKKKVFATKTKGELSLEDLPKIEELNVSVPESELKAIGKILSNVEAVLVVAAFKNSKPLNMDSVLFLSNGMAIGKVFETFGPVVEPFYTVRFNSVKELEAKGFVKDDTVYYAPNNKNVTSYIFVEELRTQKGSDASWTDNNEPPVECLDYSDDEQEREARQKRRAKTRSVSVVDEVPKKIPAVMRNMKGDFQNNMQSQPKHISFQKQSNLQFRNSAIGFSGSFFGDVQPRLLTPSRLYNSNIHIQQPGQLPVLSSKPVLLRPSQFQIPSRPRMNEWSTSEVSSQAVTFHQLNHQRPSLVNVSVQNTFIKSGGRPLANNLASQSNHSSVPRKPPNPTSCASTFGHHSRRHDASQVSNTSLQLNSTSSAMVTRPPILCSPGLFNTVPPVYPITPSPTLQQSSNFSASTIETENYKGASFRMQQKTTPELVNGMPLLQSNLNTYNISASSILPAPFQQPSRIISPPFHPGNQRSNETLPPPIPNISFIPNQLAPVPSYNYSRPSVLPSAAPNGHEDALGRPSRPSSALSNTSNFSISVPPPLLTWPAIQQPVFGMLPSNVRRNMFGIPVPIHTLPPSPGTIIPTNMIASSVMPGIIHAPPPRFFLSTPNLPFFDPSVPPPPPACKSP